MEKGGVFTEPVFFPIPSPCDVNQNIPLAIQFFKKNANACAHTSVTLCTIKEWGKGNERIEKTTVVVRMWWNQIAVYGFLVCRESSEVKQQLPFLADTSCLLLEHINCIFILHFQLCRCVCFNDWLPVKSESDLPHQQTLLFTIGFHQFTKWCMPLN